MIKMTIETLKRVLWRLRKDKKPLDYKYNNMDLRRAVLKECGYHELTYKRVRKALYRLGWMKRVNTQKIELTGDDLSDS